VGPTCTRHSPDGGYCLGKLIVVLARPRSCPDPDGRGSAGVVSGPLRPKISVYQAQKNRRGQSAT
jgi:hypothetical protein